MKLEGSLDAFGLPDIFQLLSLTRKTGGLQLRSGASAGVVYFSGGSITGAESDLSRQTLARRVVGTGTVSDEALSAAVERALTEGVGVSRALVEAGAADPDLVRDAAHEVACDAIAVLLAWPEGDFSFIVDAVNPDDVGMVLATEAVVAQSGSRQASIAEAVDAVSSTELVLGLPVSLPIDPQVSREEWSLLALADSRRTVAEIIDLTGAGYFAVLPGLAALVRRGLLEVKPEGADPLAVMRERLDLLAPLEDGLPPVPVVRQTAAAKPASAPAAAPATAEAPRAAQAPQAPAASAPSRPAAHRVADQEPEQPASDREPAHASASAQLHDSSEEPALVATIGGPHVPNDVVPPRPEPFLAKRQPEHPEQSPRGTGNGSGSVFAQPTAQASQRTQATQTTQTRSDQRPPSTQPSQNTQSSARTVGVGGVNGSAAMAADPEANAMIERDPSVNRSLLLRLIAGVRGL